MEVGYCMLHSKKIGADFLLKRRCVQKHCNHLIRFVNPIYNMPELVKENKKWEMEKINKKRCGR